MYVLSAHDDKRSQAGFTLIEMMVVLLVMAILLAVAIPIFLSTKADAQDGSSQSNLSNARLSAKALYVTEGAYPAVTDLVSVLNSQEPNLSFVKKAAGEGSNQISVNVSASGQQVVLVAYSTSGTCWALSANQGDPPASAWGGLRWGFVTFRGIHQRKAARRATPRMPSAAPKAKRSRVTLGAWPSRRARRQRSPNRSS